ncbi:MAG: antitoxin [Candidatus Aenigmarchaeota archaeon]|nr:antitoxin [Candidatus Aenigmarchaeota archaeon]
MGTKTISILDEAYESLKREKDNEESFSDVILRLTKKRGRIMDSFGKWKMSDKEVNNFMSELKRSWERFGKK